MKRTVFLILTVILISVFQSSVCDWTSYKKFITRQTRNATFLKLFREHAERSRTKEPQEPEVFPCKTYRVFRRKINVHRLTPADINVVAALGDSMTAGMGIKEANPLSLLALARGSVFSIGGDGTYEDHVTLPNIIKKYNPNVNGFSVGTGLSFQKNAHLNVAVLGDTYYGLSRQAVELIQRMHNPEEGVNFENDWKIITLLIGANSLGASCVFKDMFSVAMFVEEIRMTLDILHQNVPKAFVNLLLAPNMVEAIRHNGDPFCTTLIPLMCPCSSTKFLEKTMSTNRRLYNEALYKLIDSGRYDTRDDFTVVIQPFLERAAKPRHDNGTYDLSLFSVDCYHPNKMGHSFTARALWNNMIQPIGQKEEVLTGLEHTECPSARKPYFFTRVNSKRSWIP